MVITLTEDIILESEPEKQDKNQISEKTFWKLSDFELKFSQRLRFWFEVFTTRQIMDWKKCNALDFEFIIFRYVRLWNCLHPQKSRFGSFDSLKMTYFAIFVFFKQHLFELKFSLRDRLWIEKNTTPYILNLRKGNASDLELKIYNVSDFDCTSFAVGQVFIHSSKHGMFR